MGIGHLEQREAAPEALGCAPFVEMRGDSGRIEEWTPVDRVVPGFQRSKCSGQDSGIRAGEPNPVMRPNLPYCPQLTEIDAIPGLATIRAYPCPRKANLAMVFINSTRQNNARMRKSLKHLTDMLH